MLRKSRPSDVLPLSKDILNHQIHRDVAKENQYNCPYRTSVWMTILYETKLNEPKDLLQLMGGSAAIPESLDPVSPMTEMEIELADALAWASTHMTEMNTICKNDEPKRRLGFLRDLLEYLSHRLIDSKMNNRVAFLWGGDKFAQLLRCSSKSSHNNKSWTMITK